MSNKNTLSKKKLFFLLKAVVSFGLIGLLLWRADLRATWAAIEDLYWPAFGLALLSTVFGVMVRAGKWHLLLHAQGGTGSFGNSMRVTFISNFFNNLFLGTLGGDAFRVYDARHYSNSTGGAASAVVMERATGLAAAMALVLTSGSLLASEDLVTARLLWVISIVGVVVAVGLMALVLLGPRIARIRMLHRVGFLAGFVKDLIASLWAYKQRPALLATAMLLSLLFHAVQTVTVYWFAEAARTDVPFLSLLFITPLTGILVVLPISINGIGVKEGSFIFYLEKIGVPGPAALLIAISGRVGNLLMSLIGGLLLLIQPSARSRKTAMTVD